MHLEYLVKMVPFFVYKYAYVLNMQLLWSLIECFNFPELFTNYVNGCF